MRGLGTIINTLAVIVGGLIGMRFQSVLSEKMQTTLMQSCGIATIFIGTAGTLAKMLTVTDGVFSTQGTMLLILSLVFGGLIGEWIDLEAKMETVGEKIKAAVKRENDSRFVDGIISDGACSAAFDENGDLAPRCGQPVPEYCNLFTRPLRDILKEAFPKAADAGSPA